MMKLTQKQKTVLHSRLTAMLVPVVSVGLTDRQDAGLYKLYATFTTRRYVTNGTSTLEMHGNGSQHSHSLPFPFPFPFPFD